jgi:acyl-CoA dehydrogenase
MLKRSFFTPRHEALRARVSAFLDREVAPHYASWERAGSVPREAWARAGALGLLCPSVPEAYGGPGGDFLDSVVVIEEVSRRRLTGFMTYLQSDIVVPYIHLLGHEQQKRRYLPACVTGERLVAVAMTEPHSGSDLGAIRTTASKVDGRYVLDGEKMHVSSGMSADLLIVAARTSAAGSREGLSLFLVDAASAGLGRRALRKAGVRALDTAHVTFERCLVPADNLLGAEGMGFVYLVRLLNLERLVLAIGAQAACAQILRDLVADCASRRTSQGSVLDYQNTRFTVADLLSETAVNQTFVDQCIALHLRGETDPQAFCVAKLRTTEALKKAALHAVQLRGARGVSAEDDDRAAQDLLDACVQTVWGGTNEIMRDIIGKGIQSWM